MLEEAASPVLGPDFMEEPAALVQPEVQLVAATTTTIMVGVEGVGVGMAVVDLEIHAVGAEGAPTVHQMASSSAINRVHRSPGLI